MLSLLTIRRASAGAIVIIVHQCSAEMPTGLSNRSLPASEAWTTHEPHIDKRRLIQLSGRRQAHETLSAEKISKFVSGFLISDAKASATKATRPTPPSNGRCARSHGVGELLTVSAIIDREIDKRGDNVRPSRRVNEVRVWR